MGGDTLDFTGDGDGTRVRLRVSAGASRSRVFGPYAGALKISVKAPPERGKANREVLSLVAETFGLAPSDVALVAGDTVPDKVVRLPISPDEAARRWTGAAGRGRV